MLLSGENVSWRWGGIDWDKKCKSYPGFVDGFELTPELRHVESLARDLQVPCGIHVLKNVFESTEGAFFIRGIGW